MIRKDYNSMILKRIEKNFDRIMPIGSIVAWASALTIYKSTIPQIFVFYNIIIGFIFLVLSFVNKRLTIETKILVTIAIPSIMGVLSFMDGGFGSAGLTLLMISNVIAVMYLSKSRSISIAAISIVIFIGLFGYSKLVVIHIAGSDSDTLWLIQFLVFTLYLFILHTVVYSIRDYLLKNIEELEDSVEKTFYLAYYDQLTSLPNQHRFKLLLREQITSDRGGFIVIFSIINLSIINSIYNDEISDRVLVHITEIFNKIKSNTEVLSKISGDEFALWIDTEDLTTFKNRMTIYKTYFDEKFYIPKMTKKIEFTVGYTKHHAKADIEETFHKAKLALTYAKTLQSESMVPYDETLEAVLRSDELIKERLSLALQNDEFTIYYQSKIDAITREVVSVEALSRWTDDILGSVSPSRFIPILEELNKSVEFGELLINKVFRDYEILCEKYQKPLSVAINISPTHLLDTDFLDYIRHEIIQFDLLPRNVILEITEGIMIENFNEVSKIIESIKSLGFKISLDDFGSGYSSLAYLVKLNIDELKIDKSFVEQINKNDKIDKMIEMIVTLSEYYKLNIVAEGVETKEQYEKLLEFGCHEIQGFYFSKPEPIIANIIKT